MRLKQQYSTEGKLIGTLLISDVMHMGVQLGISPSVGLVKFELFRTWGLIFEGSEF